MANKPEHTQIMIPEGRNRTDDFYADYWAIPESETGEILADGYIHAPRRGNEIMAEVMQALKAFAKKTGKTVRHEFIATNDAANSLAERTKGYTLSDETRNGKRVYIRRYSP